MDQKKIDMFFIQNAKCFTPAQALDLKSRMQALEDDSILMYSAELKDPTVVLMLSIFLGYLGIDRFFIGDIGMGVGKLLTGGGCGIWTIIDWFFIMDATRDKNYQTMINAMMMQ